MRRELDPQKKRWIMRMNICEENCATMGIMTESLAHGSLKLQTMIDARIACIAKNYTVDEQTMLAINSLDKQSTKSYDAPDNPLDPVFISKKGPKEQMASASSARKRGGADMDDLSDYESGDEDSDRMRMSSSLTLRKASGRAAGEKRQTSDKRISMPTEQLKRELIMMFQDKSEYRLNEMVEVLNHPVQPLKAMLKELADFDKSSRVYKLKSHLCFR